MWLTPSRGNFSFEELISDIRNHIKKNTGFDYEVIVGTDSQCHHEIGSTKYVTAIVVRKVGYGALYYYRKNVVPMIPTLRQKMWNEALSTYDVLEKVKESVSDIVSSEKIIPHLDVGYSGKSKKYIKELTSMFFASGYDIKIKPDSYVASGVADKHSK